MDKLRKENTIAKATPKDTTRIEPRQATRLSRRWFASTPPEGQEDERAPEEEYRKGMSSDSTRVGLTRASSLIVKGDGDGEMSRHIIGAGPRGDAASAAEYEVVLFRGRVGLLPESSQARLLHTRLAVELYLPPPITLRKGWVT